MSYAHNTAYLAMGRPAYRSDEKQKFLPFPTSHLTFLIRDSARAPGNDARIFSTKLTLRPGRGGTEAAATGSV
jgi:hypothetical protein